MGTSGGKFLGSWEADQWSKGVHYAADGSVYDGEFKDGLPHGKGRCTYLDRSFYDGMWECGRREGSNGHMEYPNGDEYEGGWSNDMRNGEGTQRYANGETYIGGWKDGRKFGHGKEIYPDGSEYEGSWTT